jgi:hypothetical protein
MDLELAGKSAGLGDLADERRDRRALTTGVADGGGTARSGRSRLRSPSSPRQGRRPAEILTLPEAAVSILLVPTIFNHSPTNGP